MGPREGGRHAQASMGLGYRVLSLCLLQVCSKHNCFSLAKVTLEEKSSPAKVMATALSSQPQPSQRGAGWGPMRPAAAFQPWGPRATHVSTYRGQW